MIGDFEVLKGFLTGTPFFGALDDLQLDRVIRLLTERQRPAGEAVYQEGDTGRSMFIIDSGEILMTRRGESGLDVKLVRLHRGDFFGETTLIEMQPRPTSAIAVSDTKLYELTNGDLYKLYKDDIKAYVIVLQNMNRELCRRLRRADTRITAIADEAGDEATQIRLTPIKR